MPHATLRLLGPLEIEDAEGRPIALSTRKAEALLAVLALAGGANQSRDTLIGLLWGDRSERQARHSLSQTLTILRRALGDGVVDADRASVGLTDGAIEADIAAFRAAQGTDDYDAARAALSLYRGPLLDGFALREDAFEHWLADERRSLHENAVALALAVGMRALERGDDAAAQAALERAVTLDPLSEPAQLALVRHHRDRGRPEAAARQYNHYAELLRRELDLEPGEEITAVWRDAVAQPTSTRAPLETQGERKHVTALALSLSPRMDGSVDAEDIHAMLADARRDAGEIVRHHGGQVTQETSEGALALFGAPVAIEDHAVRACAAAIDIGAALRDGSAALTAAIAMDSGEVVLQSAAAQGASGQQIFGLCVHRAGRLAASGRIDGVAATRTTYDIARARIDFEGLDALPLDAGSPPVEMFRPTGRRAAARAGRDRLTKFVGREAEAEFLRAAIEPVERGQGQLVALVGEAGIGKSRLVREFLEADVPDGWRRAATSGDPQFADSPHYPIAGLLRDLVGLTEGVDIETTRSRVTTALGTLDPDLADQVTPLLWLLGDSPADPEWSTLEPAQRQRRLVDAVVSLLHRQAEEQPLVVVIEDLHWLDVASRQVIENLIETLIAARILLIVNYRPEFAHGWAGRRFYRQLHIDPLPDGGMRALLDAMLGDDESVEAVKTQVIDRAGGNPFFLEECIKSIEASGLLEGETGRYRASADAAKLILPESVHAVIEARVDRLEPADKQLLQIASVIGIEVPKALIESVCPLESAAFEDGLSRLQQAEFLIPHRVVPDPVYRFKHALTHDVVYGAMLRQARRDLHLAVLDAIEGQQASRASDQVDMLAFHAQRAEDWARAARYGRQAGMNAAARSANREAVTLYRQALDALQHLPETRDRRAAEIDVHVEIRNAFFVLGEAELVTDHLKQAGEIAAAIEDRARECRADLLLSGWYWQRGEHIQALERAEQAIELATGEGDDVLIALCLYRRGLNRHALGQYDGAVQDLEMSFATLEKVGSGDLFAFGGYPSVFCESFLAWSLAEMGRMEDALRVGEAGWARAESLKNAYSQTVMSFGFGTALVRAGDYEQARSILEEGLELNRLTEVPATYPWIVSALGYALVKLGSADQGLECAREAVSAEVRPRGPLYAHPYLWLAEALLDQGDKKAAIDAAETGKVIAEAQGEAGHLAWARRLLGDCWFATDPIRAREHLEIAETLAADTGMEPLAAAVRTSLARMKNLL